MTNNPDSAVVPIDSLVAADSPRLAGENQQHARLLAGAPGQLPPIIVHRSTMRVIDGMHRLMAARLRGDEQVEVRYFDGDEAAAFVLAVRSNVEHGLPLTLADRKEAADRILGLYPGWSDRMIASVTGLSPPTVAARRRGLTEKNSRLDTRIGRDGRARPVDIEQRRQVAINYITENPDASLRQVATRAGLSRETVRKIRNELDRNHDSGPPSRSQVERADEPPADVRQRIDVKLNRDDGRGLDALRADPAFRSADIGRAVLQVLAGSQALHTRLEQILGMTPAHCLGRLEDAARHCAGKWLEFAVQAEQRRILLESDGSCAEPPL